MPAGLRRLARSHQQLFYDLIFRVSAAAVQYLARDPRFIGGQVGMVGVLHILRQAQDRLWGRNLAYHPDVHYLVPAGDLADDGQSWRPACNLACLR